MKMKIIILEDQPIEARQLKQKCLTWSSQNNYNIELFEYRSGEDFFNNFSPDNYDSCSVFFLDIQMSGMSGLDVAKRLRKENCQKPIIFLTAFREYVFHGYEVHAMNYLLKPLKSTPLFLCLDEIAKNLTENSYLYRCKQDIVRIPYKNILTFSSNLHYVDILTLSGSYCQYSTLNSIIDYLPKEFIRVHRSCIVNMAHIYKISGNTIVLSNNMTTQIGRTYLKDVILSFTRYSTRLDEKGVFYDN